MTCSSSGIGGCRHRRHGSIAMGWTGQREIRQLAGRARHAPPVPHSVPAPTGPASGQEPPRPDGVWTDYFTLTELLGERGSCPRCPLSCTPTTGPHRVRRSRYAAAAAPSSRCAISCRTGTPRGARVHHVGAPARLGVAAAVRRLRQRHHRARAGTRTTSYPNFQPARTLWYHDHGVHHTAQNAYAGPGYAQYHMHDPAERELLPQGEFDVPLTIGDAIVRRRRRLTLRRRRSPACGETSSWSTAGPGR